MKNESTASLIKIGELAKASGTNVSTIKFYVKEGLIQAASKTSPNMAYYHTDCVARVQLIKSLQKEHYYPLSVIKRMLSASGTNQTEIQLLDVIHKADPNATSKTLTFTEASKVCRLSKDQINILVQHKLINPDLCGKKQRYTESDLQIMVLIRQRMDAGIPFEESVSSFTIYEDALQQAAKADVDFFITQALLTGAPSTEKAVQMISISDDTLDRFISLKRKELNREYGSERLGDLDRFASNLSAALEGVSDVLGKLKYPEPQNRCLDALTNCPEDTDPVSACLRYFHLVIHSMSGSLAKGISVCGQAHAHFSSLIPEEFSGMDSLLLYSLKLCWLNLAPSLLNCEKEALEIREGFTVFAYKCIGAKAELYTERVLAKITRIGGIS